MTTHPWKLTIRTYIIGNLRGRWIGHAADKKQWAIEMTAMISWLDTLRYFLWGYVKGLVYVHPLPTGLDELKQGITAALKTYPTHTAGCLAGAGLTIWCLTSHRGGGRYWKILKTCKIVHIFHIHSNFSLKLWRINPILPSNKSIRYIYISNDIKCLETPCI